ncbi:Down syndrome cell adhesion molecule [Araneus ventricosus]|uniref:Down syndrome cell adhesion molecule n=1 Tax=Araneus ventricosus TaxID=182803 RepID=A0A4Y2HQ56_ARAVE|nr:Down syndrome cell adhesion molecule [Araneus ventricosus]
MWFVSLLVILCAKGFVSLSKLGGVPFIQPFTFPNDVIKGQSVTVTCAVADGSGTFDFRWAKDGQPLTDQPLTRIQTFEEYSLLFLKSVDSSRSGNYTCFVINTGGSANHTAQLVVYERSEWNVLPDDAEVVYGSDLRMDCSATGIPPPKIQWTKVSSESTGGRHRTMLNGSMILIDVHSDDGGEYECSASNGIGESIRKTVTVIVHVPPQFHESYHLQKARSGHSAVLRCDVTGDSPIKVKWSKEYMDNTDSRYKIQETPLPNGLLSELYISRVLRKDAGVYVCSATNSYGKQDKSIKLLVLAPSGYPTDLTVYPSGPNELIIRWKAPAPDQRNGAIQGYELGYREYDSMESYSMVPYTYREAPLGPSVSQEYVLDRLKDDTEYEIVVRAYNRAGKGPTSVPVVGKTKEIGTLESPDLWVESTTATSISLRWSGNNDFKSGTLRHILHYRAEGNKWMEKSIPSTYQDSYVLTDLEENTLYYLYIQAVSGLEQSKPSGTVSSKTSDPSFERSSMTQMQEVSHQTTLVISLSVVISCVVIVCVIAGACVYVTRVTARSGFKRDGHALSEFGEQHASSRSTPLSRHTSNFRYVDPNSRPLLWCSTPAPPNDYPSPYATLPLRPTPISKRWQSEDGMSPAVSERSESLINQRVEVPEDKISNNRE